MLLYFSLFSFHILHMNSSISPYKTNNHNLTLQKQNKTNINKKRVASPGWAWSTWAFVWCSPLWITAVQRDSTRPIPNPVLQLLPCRYHNSLYHKPNEKKKTIKSTTSSISYPFKKKQKDNWKILLAFSLGGFCECFGFLTCLQLFTETIAMKLLDDDDKMRINIWIRLSKHITTTYRHTFDWLVNGKKSKSFLYHLSSSLSLWWNNLGIAVASDGQLFGWSGKGRCRLTGQTSRQCKLIKYSCFPQRPTTIQSLTCILFYMWRWQHFLNLTVNFFVYQTTFWLFDRRLFLS